MVVASVWSGIFWPFVPILLGGWVLALLVIRSFVVYKIYPGASPENKGKALGKKSVGSRLESTKRDGRPETIIKYAHRIISKASEDLGLCGIGIPFCARRRTCTLDVRGRSKGKGRGRWRSSAPSDSVP